MLNIISVQYKKIYKLLQLIVFQNDISAFIYIVKKALYNVACQQHTILILNGYVKHVKVYQNIGYIMKQVIIIKKKKL